MNLKESLETIKDIRIDRCKKHSLVDILMIVFFGLLCRYWQKSTPNSWEKYSSNMQDTFLGTESKTGM